MVESAHYVTPPALARQYGIKPEKVIVWIRRGELRAVNVAERVGGRPRWRISAEAIEEFERRRSAVRPAKTHRRRKRKPEIRDIIK